MAALAEELTKLGQPTPDVRIAKWDETPKTKLGPFGAEPEWTEEEAAIVDTLTRFAENEMRPIGEILDRMSPEEVIAPGSPLC